MSLTVPPIVDAVPGARAPSTGDVTVATMDAPRVKTFFATLWTAIGIAIIAAYYASTLAGSPRLHPNQYPFIGAIYLLWVPFVPLLVRLARSHEPIPGRRLRAVLIHVGFAAVIIVVKLQLHRMVFCAGFDCCYVECVLGIRLQTWFAHWVMNETYVYASTIAGIWAFDATHRAHLREIAVAEKERALAAAELHAEQGRIAPHEVTSMLAAIASMVQADPRGAEQRISSVADRLRAQTMRGSGA